MNLVTNIYKKLQQTRKYWWMLLYFSFGSGIPITLFLIEFYKMPSSNITREQNNEFVFDVITTYSPLFIYACIAGFLLPYFLIQAYDHFKSTIVDKHLIKIRRTTVKIAVFVSVLVTVADFFGGEPAIWEIRPPYHSEYIHQFINPAVSTIQFPHADSLAKIKYKEGIKKTLSNNNMSHWSLTRYSYIFSILIEAFFLNSFFYLCFFYYAFRKPLKNSDEVKFYNIINGLAISSLLIFIWLVLRSMNSTEKNKLYPTHDLQVANIAIGLLNILCLFAITITSLTNSKIRKFAQETVGILVTLGISGGSIIGYIKPEVLVAFFGKKAAIINYIVFPIVFILLYGAYYIINLGFIYDRDHNLTNEDLMNGN